jgi:hypothetical protein
LATGGSQPMAGRTGRIRSVTIFPVGLATLDGFSLIEESVLSNIPTAALHLKLFKKTT